MTHDEILEREQELVSGVKSDQLMEHLRAIAKWERLSGSTEELEAFHYIQQTLDDYGYSTRLQQCEALISLPKNACLKIAELGEIACITHSMSASVENLKGEVVYCNFGRSEDYQKVDVHNKIALVEGIAMPGKVKAGENAGAIAQIHICGDQLHEMCISTVYGSPTSETVQLLPKTPSITIFSTDGERIKSKIHDNPVHAEIMTEVDTRYRHIPVLTADLPGSIESDFFVLFSGHVDSWYFGAMDNGSANATQLEIARLLAEFAPHRRGIRLAFWSGHSHGRYAGSTWYADNYWEELSNHCIVNINIDSVGGKGATVLTNACAMQELRPLAQSVIAELAGQEYIGSRIGRAGDHSFMGIGIPAMLMDLSQQPVPEFKTPTSRAFALLTGDQQTGGLGWWWHTQHDTIDKIDPELLQRDARIYTKIVHRLMNAPMIPIDLRLTVAEINNIITDYQEKAAGHFDLGPILARAEQLQTEINDLYSQSDPLQDGSKPDSLKSLNRGLLRLSQILTRLNYTEAGPFSQDPANAQPSMPLLRHIDSLVNLSSGSDEYKQILTLLIRRRNSVGYALHEAIEAVRSTRAKLGASRN